MSFSISGILVSYPTEQLFFQCKSLEFTCDNGLCIDLDKRCDNVFDCLDSSDEDHCEALWIHEKNYRKTLPPFSRHQKTIIKVNLIITEITKVDEISMIFKAGLKLTLQWKDGRINFKNLANGSNFLNKHWQHQIWLPPLFYTNTEDNVQILKGDIVQVEVLRQGKPKYNTVSRLNEGRLFNGEENELQLIAKDELEFACLYNLLWFPFDTQKCSIDIRIPLDLRDYITLETKTVTYRGNY